MLGTSADYLLDYLQGMASAIPPVYIIEHLTDDQIDHVVELLVRAYDGDPSLWTMTGGNNGLIPSLFRSMIRAINVAGTLYAVNDDSGKIRTIGAWFRPGVRIFDTEEQRSLGWNDFMNSLSQKAKEWWTHEFPSKHSEPMSKALGTKYRDSWFASIIATDPDYQRRGYATAIVQAVLDRARKEQKIVTLATQNQPNAEWYKSMGFEVFGQAEFEGPMGRWPDIFLKYGDD